MLEVIENACTPFYLDTLKHHAMNANTWHMRYPNNSPDKHLKMDIIENDVKQPVLAGLAMGLLIHLYGQRQDLVLPDVSYCGIGLKDRHRLDNPHTDHVNDPDYIKIFGVINSDWGPQDGGLFMHGDQAIPCVPCSFIVFDPRITHHASEITSDKKRLGIDFTVKRT